MKSQSPKPIYFDENGNLKFVAPQVSDKHTFPQNYVNHFNHGMIPRAENSQDIHFKRLTTLKNKWMSIHPEFRFHAKALVGCVLCFSCIFFPSLWFDDKLELIESRARVDPELMKKSNFIEYKRRKYGYSFNPFSHFLI